MLKGKTELLIALYWNQKYVNIDNENFVAHNLNSSKICGILHFYYTLKLLQN